MPMREELFAQCAKHTLQSAKHEHSRGVWGHAPTGNVDTQICNFSDISLLASYINMFKPICCSSDFLYYV